MIRKAILIQAIFFCAAAVLVITSVALMGFIGSQGFQVFRYVTPGEFFFGTTWNPIATHGDTVAENLPVTDAAAAGQPDVGGQLIEPSEPIDGGQLIEPSESVEGEQSLAPTASADGQPIDGGQLIEPSEPVEGEQALEPTAAADGQPIDGGQLIEPSEPLIDETSDGGGQLIEPSESIAGAEGASTEQGSTPLEDAPNSSVGLFGVLPLLIGSLITALVTLLISAPLAILVAIFMVEIAPEAVRRFMRTTVEIFASLPSVIFGLLGLVYVVPWVRETFHTGLGKGILAASIVLIFMTQPTIVTIAEDALRTLPNGLREAAWGVGATRWQMIWGILLPAARPGLFTAVILGMGRAIGETMAVQMVIGNITEYIPTSVVTGASTMPAAIVTQLPEAATPAHRAALIMVGFVLLATSFLLIALARLSVRNTPLKV